MEIRRIAGLLTAVKNEVPTEWKFNFFTPKALSALVTFAVVIGTDDWVFRFVTLDSTPDLDKVIGITLTSS
ncbi:MAG: hypothetical protein WCD24_17540 [Serratia inhibens]|uniref:hypothetical protein n=1 Tax=Serratia inhibens TaxID=2338073 RepID=UPI003C7DDDA9